MPSILFLTRWYPPHSGHFVRQLAEAVSAVAEVAVLIVEPAGRRYNGTPGIEFSRETEAHIPTLRIRCRHLESRIPGAGILNTLSYLTAQARGLMILRRRGFRFDLLHVHVLTRTAVLPLLLAGLRRKPVVLSEYWTRYIPGVRGYDGWLRRWVTKLAVSRADAVTAVSGYLKGCMEAQGLRNRQFVVIPPAIDTRLFTPAPAAPRNKKRMIHISNFSDGAKNVSGILRVLRRLTGSRDDFECLFIGGAEPHTTEAKSMAGSLGLSGGVVSFPGPLFGEALAKAVQESDFLVMFSRYETFSVVIQECLSAGKPVVTAAIGPIPELVGPEAGILVPPEDEEALFRALSRMLDAFGSYDPQALHHSVERRFGYAAAGAALGALYGRLLS